MDAFCDATDNGGSVTRFTIHRRKYYVWVVCSRVIYFTPGGVSLASVPLYPPSQINSSFPIHMSRTAVAFTSRYSSNFQAILDVALDHYAKSDVVAPPNCRPTARSPSAECMRVDVVCAFSVAFGEGVGQVSKSQIVRDLP